ncbi:MFS transporter [Rhizobium vallis]|uniref:MFS transporter n=1 Tax=Rhizobium vallis TaxID=634290 RepID=A0A3S0QPF3_9HYPH|nr:MFS transporter [Rhizobium vallis]RUM24383.1 MFS transporter [Rhizobium vallis]
MSQNESKRRLGAGAIGNFGEIYDFAVFGFSVPILSQHFFPKSDPTAAILSTFAVYAVAFFARPIGGLVFGYLADRIGRVKVLAITIWLMAAGTAIIGLLPTYASVGVLAPTLLVLCRLAQGFALGGETTGSTSYILESAPDDRRGWWVGIVWFFAHIPNALVALMLAGLQFVAGEELYGDWLWRLPFILGGLIGVIGFWLRRSLDDPEEYKAAVRDRKDSNSFRSMARTGGYKPILYVLMVQPVQTVGSYLLLGFMYAFLVKEAHLHPTDALMTNAVAILVLSAIIPLSGRLSDRIGRKKVFTLGALWILVAAYPAVMLASTGVLANAFMGQLLLAIGIGIYNGAAFPAAAEFFPTSYRATGHAIAYQLAVAIFGGTTPLIATWLVSSTGSALAPGLYVTAIAFIGLILVQFVPETKGIRLRTAAASEEETPLLVPSTSR